MNAQREDLEKHLGLSGLRAWKNRYAGDIYTLGVHGSNAIRTWEALREKAAAMSYWPVVCGDPEEAERVLGMTESSEGQSAEQILSRAVDLNAKKFLQDRAAASDETDTHGDWPARPNVMKEFVLPYDTLKPGQPKPEVLLAFVPCRSHWEVPAVLNFGGWNECPYPHEHVCMLKDWSQRYGALLVGMSGDTVEMFVARKPKSRAQALELAREQFLYCEDIVLQGVGTIEHLAATLMETDKWFFWWD